MEESLKRLNPRHLIALAGHSYLLKELNLERIYQIMYLFLRIILLL